MLGKALDVHMITFTSTAEYDIWVGKEAYDYDILDVKFSVCPQSSTYQNSYAILVIYKEI